MMHHSPAMKMVGMITWAITALVSINTLTEIYGYDFIGYVLLMTPGLAVPFAWIIGISGMISLAMLVKACFMCCPGCGSCPCTCNK